MPNLIFFPDYFDQVENWLNFFTNPEKNILDQRNVYILYGRNFGSSDYCDEDISGLEIGEHLANDV